jgi:glutamate/tyrosine decarboxylase-like PLP-dependent enzyme
LKELLNETADRAIRYLDSLAERRVSPSHQAVDRLATLRIPLPDGPTRPSDVIKELDEIGSPATMAMPGPRFFGFVIGGALPATVAANWLAAAWDQNSGLYATTPVTAELEMIALGWLLDILGLPESSGGAFVTGATVANFTALAAARHSVLARAGWNVEADGLFGAPPITVVAGAEGHPTVYKSLGMLGLGRSRVVKVPVDDQGRFLVDELPVIEGPTIVCLQAGNVNTGAFDPIKAVCERAHNAGAWVHVDGAFGLWARAAPSYAHLAEGLEAADSWATDAHKWLNVPYDSGVAFVRHADALQASLAITAEYLPTETEYRNPSDFTPELSRRGRGIEIWAALKSLGRSGVAEMIERNCRQARRFADGFEAAGFEVLNDVVLNQVLVSFGDPEKTNRIIAEIQSDGTCWCGGTVWQGKTAMRVSVSCWSTTDADVERSLEAMLRIASKYKTERGTEPVSGSDRVDLTVETI